MATPLDCPEIERWQALLDLDLPPDQVGWFERHLQSCPACQDRLDREPEGEEELRRCARRIGDPTVGPADTTLSLFLVQMRERKPQPVPDEPPDLYFLSPGGAPDILGTLGGYEVLEVIGQGGMGVVLKAYEPALYRTVAIKVLAAAVAGSATARRRFTREAKAAAAVCHDHIVPVYGVQEADGLPYLVMQYVAGESLQERLDRVGPLDVEEVVRIGMQTAQGLAAAHAQGLIHRDIKPANLLLEGEPGASATGGRVKITDFGLARMADDVQLTQAGVVAGTPEYMAPEQARGETADHRADLFSLGSVLYACCAGTAPFHGPTAFALLHAVNEHAPAPLRSLNPAVPVWLEALIARLMAKGPADRFQSAAEVAALLEGYLAHLRQPATSPAPELPLRTRHPLRLPFVSTSLRVAVILLAVLGALGAVAFLLFGPGDKARQLAELANGKVAPEDPYVVWSVAISPDGKALAAGAGWWTRTGEVGVWDLATYKPLRHFAEERGVGSVAFSPDSKLLAIGGWTSHVRVLDWAAGKVLFDFSVSGLAHVAFTPDGSSLVTASEGADLHLWDLSRGELAEALRGDLLRFHRVIFSPDGKRLLACGGDWKKGGINHLGVWDLASRKQIQKLAGHDNTVYCVACSPDGKIIATGSVDHTIRLYDAETGQLLRALRGPMRPVDQLAFTADGKTLLSCGPEPLVRFWDVEQGKETRQFDTGIKHVRAFQLTADGKTLIAGGQEKSLKVFNLATQEQVAALWGGTGTQKQEMDALPASTPEPADEDRSYANVRLLVLTLAAALTLGLIFLALVRRKRAARVKSEPEPAAAMISFTCSACGAKLKAKAALAGKKVKCTRCAGAVSVPSVQAGEPR